MKKKMFQLLVGLHEENVLEVKVINGKEKLVRVVDEAGLPMTTKHEARTDTQIVESYYDLAKLFKNKFRPVVSLQDLQYEDPEIDPGSGQPLPALPDGYALPGDTLAPAAAAKSKKAPGAGQTVVAAGSEFGTDVTKSVRGALTKGFLVYQDENLFTVVQKSNPTAPLHEDKLTSLEECKNLIIELTE